MLVGDDLFGEAAEAAETYVSAVLGFVELAIEYICHILFLKAIKDDVSAKCWVILKTFNIIFFKELRPSFNNRMLDFNLSLNLLKFSIGPPWILSHSPFFQLFLYS